MFLRMRHNGKLIEVDRGEIAIRLVEIRFAERAEAGPTEDTILLRKVGTSCGSWPCPDGSLFLAPVDVGARLVDAGQAKAPGTIQPAERPPEGEDYKAMPAVYVEKFRRSHPVHCKPINPEGVDPALISRWTAAGS
jgi:hypothetical protein